MYPGPGPVCGQSRPAVRRRGSSLGLPSNPHALRRSVDWTQSHGDSHIPTIGRGIAGYERRPAPVGASGAQKREKRRQVGGPRIQARQNFTTPGDRDRTHLPQASSLRQPTHPSSGPGQRTARGDGFSITGTDIRSGLATEAQTSVPEIVTTNSKAAGGAGILGE